MRIFDWGLEGWIGDKMIIWTALQTWHYWNSDFDDNEGSVEILLENKELCPIMSSIFRNKMDEESVKHWNFLCVLLDNSIYKSDIFSLNINVLQGPCSKYH